MTTSIIFNPDEITGIYRSVVDHETQIESLRNRLNAMPSPKSTTIPLCIACGNAIEDVIGVGYAYCLESERFPGVKREYLVCVWCRETILWNEVRQQFLNNTKLTNFDLFNDDEEEED